MSRTVFNKPYANNKDAYPHSLISIFAVRCPDSIASIFATSKISRPLLASVAEQVVLNLTLLKTDENKFSCNVAQTSLPLWCMMQ